MFCNTIAISHETSPMKCSRFIRLTSLPFHKMLLCSWLLCEFLLITLLFHGVSPFSIKLSYQNFRQPQFRKAQPTNIAQVLQYLFKHFFFFNFVYIFCTSPNINKLSPNVVPASGGVQLSIFGSNFGAFPKFEGKYTCCRALQCAAVCCSVLHSKFSDQTSVRFPNSKVIILVAVRCSALLLVAVCCTAHFRHKSWCVSQIQRWKFSTLSSMSMNTGNSAPSCLSAWYLTSARFLKFEDPSSILLTLWHTATHYNALLHNTTQRNTTQHNANHCNTKILRVLFCHWHCHTLQHTATHCNTLQHIATHCNTLQHTATHCNTMQHNATQCNT